LLAMEMCDVVTTSVALLQTSVHYGKKGVCRNELVDM
jgi:hypothetical protein